MGSGLARGAWTAPAGLANLFARESEERPPGLRDRKRPTMAKSQIKSGGPTRGRQRLKKMGMGAGKNIAKIRAKKLG